MIVPATREHISAMYEEFPSYSMRAYAFVKDKVLGVAGVYQYQGHRVAFVNISDEAKKYKKDLILLSRKVVPLIDGFRVFAYQDKTIGTSEGLLRRFGFQPVENDLWLKQ